MILCSIFFEGARSVDSKLISRLFVKNFIIIDSLEIDFCGTFTSITGETGTGKSIILDAIEFCFGNFNSKTIRKNPEIDVVVEVTLDEKNVIRHTITPQNRSIFHINGRVSTQKNVRELKENNIDITSQFDTILDKTTHEKIVDDFAIQNFDGTQSIIDNVENTYNTFKNLEKSIEKLQDEMKTINRDREYYHSIISDLSSIDIQKDEETILLEKRANILKMSNSKNNLTESLNILNSLQNFDTKIFQITKILDKIDGIQVIRERLDAISIEFQDIRNELENLNDSLSGFENELIEIDDRLSLIRSLARKYNTPCGMLFELLETSTAQMSVSNNFDDNLKNLEIEKSKALDEYIEYASKLSEIRRNAAKKLSNEINLKLSSLLLENAVFSINIEKNEKQISKIGIDRIEFLANFNKKNQLSPITEIASGGEAARLNFAIKTVLARSQKCRTIIFDEIDIGIGGRAAHAMGIAMRNLSTSEKIQVISITHSPQIAAVSLDHISIRKNVLDNEISISAIKMNTDERIEEIARMISGASITHDSLLAAKQLILNIQ